MKPASAAPPRINSLPCASSPTQSPSPTDERPNPSNHRATSPFPAQRASFRLALPTHLPNAPNYPRPPHPTDRVLSTHVLCLCCSFLCIRRSIPCAPIQVLFWVKVPRRYSILCVVYLSFLVITPRPSPHQNTTLSRSPSHHHHPLPHLTSPRTLQPHVLPLFFLLLLLSSCRI
jgi:hypothetical protein